MNAIIKDDVTEQTSIRTKDLPHILNRYANKISVLSLDCFDTLLWRHTATPRDVFSALQQKPLSQSLGMTAYQRQSAAARTYREKNITHGHHQICLADIYSRFHSLNPHDQAALIEEEINTETELCYAYPPMVDLIRKAHAQGLQIIIVSDIYMTEAQLRRLLTGNLPSDVMNMISHVFCSTDHQTAKSDHLFNVVQKQLNVTADKILHIGDHPTADFAAPKQQGLHALHFLQFDLSPKELLRLQQSAAALHALSNPHAATQQAPRLQPFRGVYAQSVSQGTAEESIGYYSFGPALYTFAKFITDDINAMRKAGKNPKVFFLLRDAYLLAKACEVYAGEPVGKLIRLRKFVTVAASFRTQADVDHYLSSIKPEHFNYWVICEQLLLPKELTQKIIHLAHTSAQPEQTFFQLLHQPNILEQICKQSAAYRTRLMSYIKKEMQLQTGDNVILVDTGYIGVTQEFLTRSLQNELDVTIEGRYFFGSHEPDRPNSKAFITTTWCDHGLFEQSCTYREGCVLDYHENGDPIFDDIKLSDEQYSKVQALQQETLRFVSDAKSYFDSLHQPVPFAWLKDAAAAALQRHIYFPTPAEVVYFHSFQHDKDMGPDRKKTMYQLDQRLHELKRQPMLGALHPFEARTINLHYALSGLMQRGFDLDLSADSLSFYSESINAVVANGTNAQQISLSAAPTYDGYFVLHTPLIKDEQVALIFGDHYEWVQIDTIQVVGATQQVDLKPHLIFDQMVARSETLFECANANALLLLTPLAQDAPYRFQIIFRPIKRR